MPNQTTACLRSFLGRETVQTFQSLEAALEVAESLGPDHYVIDRHGLQIWDSQRKLLRNEE
jgi:hypothetical protein